MHVYITILRVTHWSHCLTVSSDTRPKLFCFEEKEQTFLELKWDYVWKIPHQASLWVQNDSSNNINATWLLKLIEESSKWTLSLLVSVHGWIRYTDLCSLISFLWCQRGSSLWWISSLSSVGSPHRHHLHPQNLNKALLNIFLNDSNVIHSQYEIKKYF